MTHKIKHRSVRFLVLIILFGSLTHILTSCVDYFNISKDADNPQHEVAISVDPTNSDREVIVAMSEESNIRKILAYHTNNGGQSWEKLELPIPEGQEFSNAQPWSDPSVAHDHEGRVYVAYNLREGSRGTECFPPEGGEKRGCYDAIVVARYYSALGLSFYNAVAVSNWTDSEVDKPFLEVDDNPDSPEVGNIYVAWSDMSRDTNGLYIAKSTDFGETWKESRFSDRNRGSIDEVDIGIGPGGEVYVVWRTRDIRQNTRGDQVTVPVILMKNLGVAVSDPDAPVRDVAVTAGFNNLNTPGIPAVGINDGVLPLPSIDVDRSGGPNDGRIWVAYADYTIPATPQNPPVLLPAEYMNIFVTWSDDDGESWVSPIMVNLDGTLTSQFHPWLDVDDANGSVGVIYYSTQDDPENNLKVDVYLAQFTSGNPQEENNWTNRRITSIGSDSTNCYGPCYREYIGLQMQYPWAYLAFTLIQNTGDPEIFTVAVKQDR